MRAHLALLLSSLATGTVCGPRSEPEPVRVHPPGSFGTLVQPCDTKASCQSGWDCFENRCIPAQLMNNPPEHREPLLFVFESFEAIAAYGANVLYDGLYHCPGARDGRADTGLTPPADIKCAAAPEGRCVPDGTGPGGYPATLWNHPGWTDIDLRTSLPHRFHYRYTGQEEKAPSGRCLFTVQAFGDLDGDAVFSTFERSGMYDHTGLNAAAGLYIDPLRDLE